MHLAYIAVVAFTSVSHAAPDALSDFATLASLVSTLANELTSSMNYPSIANASIAMNMTWILPVGSPFPTSSRVRDISTALETSTSNCAANSSAFVDGQAMNVLDSGYLGYINGIPTLAQALVSRGRSWHPEWNQPVYQAINSLARAVYTYGTQLTESDAISSGSTIRTLSAGGTLIDAQAAWDKVGTLPGKRVRF